MKPLQCFGFFIIFISALFAESTFALQFTYNSDALYFKQGYVGGEVDDIIGTDNPPTPSFNASFITTTDNLTATLLSSDLSFSATEYPHLLTDVPAVDSSITFNEDGSIAAWHFVLAISKIILQTDDTPPNILTWFIESSHGENTCNCDWYKTEFDIYNQQPNNTWQYFTTIGVLYNGDNAADNWSFKNTEVPEPMNCLLLLSGLAMISFGRLRKITLITPFK